MKKIALLLALCLILAALPACAGSGDVSEQTYTLDCGVTITAGAGLKEASYESADGTLEEDRYSIMFSEIPAGAGMTQDEFAEYIQDLLESGDFDYKKTKDDRGVPAFWYIRNVDGIKFFYYLTIHTDGYDWWLCEMHCMASMRSLYKDRFAKWSATVTLPGAESVNPGDTKRYELDNGATLIAPKGMDVYSLGERDYALENRDLIMVLVEENKQAYGMEDMTLEEYGDFLMENSGLSARYEEDLWGNLAAGYFTEVDGEAYYCYGIVRETATSFWYFDIYCLAETREDYETAMAQWCNSLTLKDTEMFSPEETRVYELECGAVITAMDGLTEDNEGLDAGSSYLYGSGLHIGVIWMDRTEYGLWNTTREELGEEFEADGSSGTFFVDSYGSYASSFYDESDGNEYYNYMTIVEEEDGFWLCMMYCLASNEQVYADYMPQWAATVRSIE